MHRTGRLESSPRLERDAGVWGDLGGASRGGRKGGAPPRRYAQRIVGEAFTQTAKALGATEGVRALLGGREAGKRFVLSLLDGHRRRLDRLGIEPVEAD